MELSLKSYFRKKNLFLVLTLVNFLGKLYWNRLRFLPFIFIFKQCVKELQHELLTPQYVQQVCTLYLAYRQILVVTQAKNMYHTNKDKKVVFVDNIILDYELHILQLSYMQTKLHLQLKLPPRQNGVRVGPKSQTRVVTRLVARRRVCQFVFSAMQRKSLWSESIYYYITA